MIVDEHTIAMMTKTAKSMMVLAGCRGISCSVEVSPEGHYIANGHNCGSSVHGFNDWLNKQPGVKP